MSNNYNDWNWNQKVIEEFRANGGKVGGQLEGAPLLLLHTAGAKSNQPRINPLAYFKDGDNYILVAGKGGAPTNPDWYYNILAHPDVSIEVGTEHFKTHATVLERAERDRVFADIAGQAPIVAAYQKDNPRIIPIVLLERIN